MQLAVFDCALPALWAMFGEFQHIGYWSVFREALGGLAGGPAGGLLVTSQPD